MLFELKYIVNISLVSECIRMIQMIRTQLLDSTPHARIGICIEMTVYSECERVRGTRDSTRHTAHTLTARCIDHLAQIRRNNRAVELSARDRLSMRVVQRTQQPALHACTRARALVAL